MPIYNPGQLTFTEERPSFIGVPIEDIKQTNEILAQRYAANKEAHMQLVTAINNTPTSKADKEYLDNMVNQTEGIFQKAIDSGDWSMATEASREATFNFYNNKQFNAVKQRYANHAAAIKDIQDKVDDYMKNGKDSGGISREMGEFAINLMSTKFNNTKSQFDENNNLLTKDDIEEPPKFIPVADKSLAIMEKVQADVEAGNLHTAPGDPYKEVAAAYTIKDKAKIQLAVTEMLMADPEVQAYLKYQAKMDVYKSKLNSTGITDFEPSDFKNYGFNYDDNNGFYFTKQIPSIVNGKVQKDNRGNVLYEIQKDNKGKPILDEDGKPKIKVENVRLEDLNNYRIKMLNGSITNEEYQNGIGQYLINLDYQKQIDALANGAGDTGYYHKTELNYMDNQAKLKRLEEDLHRQTEEMKTAAEKALFVYGHNGTTAGMKVEDLNTTMDNAKKILASNNSSDLDKQNAKDQIKQIRDLRKQAILKDPNVNNFLNNNPNFLKHNGLTLGNLVAYLVDPDMITDPKIKDKIKNATSEYKLNPSEVTGGYENLGKAINASNMEGIQMETWSTMLKSVNKNMQTLLDNNGIANVNKYIEFRGANGQTSPIENNIAETLINSTGATLLEEGKRIDITSSNWYKDGFKRMGNFHISFIRHDATGNNISIQYTTTEKDGTKKYHQQDIHADPDLVNSNFVALSKSALKSAFYEGGGTTQDNPLFDQARDNYVNYLFEQGVNTSDLNRATSIFLTSNSGLINKVPFTEISGNQVLKADMNVYKNEHGELVAYTINNKGIKQYYINPEYDESGNPSYETKNNPNNLHLTGEDGFRTGMMNAYMQFRQYAKSQPYFNAYKEQTNNKDADYGMWVNNNQRLMRMLDDDPATNLNIFMNQHYLGGTTGNINSIKVSQTGYNQPNFLDVLEGMAGILK